MAEMLAEIARMVRSDALLRNISLSVEVKQPIPGIFAERVQMQQVIMNLVLNAFDAVAGIDDRPREVRIDAAAAGGTDGIQILVCDSGRGIAQDVMPRIFDAFFTTKPDGMGMGLAIAKSIVEAHGGQLLASPNSDRGMTFEMRLPISQGCRTGGIMAPLAPLVDAIGDISPLVILPPLFRLRCGVCATEQGLSPHKSESEEQE